MEQLLNKTEVDDLLAKLKSDRAKRRWSAIKKLAELGVNDERVALALETLAFQDPVPYVREEALSALRVPAYWALLTRYRQNKGTSQTESEHADIRPSQPRTVTEMFMLCPSCQYPNRATSTDVRNVALHLFNLALTVAEIQRACCSL